MSRFLLILDGEKHNLQIQYAIPDYLKKRYVEAAEAVLIVDGTRTIKIPCDDLCSICGTHKNETIGERLHVCKVYKASVEAGYPIKLCIADQYALLVKYNRFPYENIPRTVRKILDRRIGRY